MMAAPLPAMNLSRAATTNDIHSARFLLDAGHYPNEHISWNVGSTVSPILFLEDQERLNNGEYGFYQSTPLNIAVFSGHEQMVELLLESGADPTLKDSLGRNALTCAIYGIDTVTVTSENITQASFTHPSHLSILRRLLLSFKPSFLNEPNLGLNGITPLCLASYLGKYKVVLALVKDGKADVDAPDSNGATPLMYAARDGHTNIVQLLLEYEARPDLVDCNAWSSLQYARAFPEITILLEENLRQSRQNVQKNLSLSHHLSGITAVVYPNFLGRLTSLLSDLPSPRVTTFSESEKPVSKITERCVSNRERMEAIKRNDHLKLESLLFSPNGNSAFLAENPINHPDVKSGSTLLHHTARVRPVPSLENIVLLYQAGADVNAQTYDGRTVLHHLCRFKGAKSRRPSSLPLPDSNEHKEGKPATHEELHDEHIANCADLLIRLGALINIKDRLGNTPIHYAVLAEGKLELVKTLVKAGSDLNIRNNNGKTPAECAADYCTRKMLWEVNPPLTKLETTLIPLQGYNAEKGNQFSPPEVRDALRNLKRSSIMTLSVNATRGSSTESDTDPRRWNSTRTMKGSKKHFSLSVISKMLGESRKSPNSISSPRDSRSSLGVSYTESDKSDGSDEECEEPIYVGEGIMSPRAALQAKQQNRISPRLSDYKRSSSISLLTRTWKDQNNGEIHKSKRGSRSVTIVEQPLEVPPNAEITSSTSSSNSNPTFIITKSDQEDRLSIITDASSITSESSEEPSSIANEQTIQALPCDYLQLQPTNISEPGTKSASCPDLSKNYDAEKPSMISWVNPRKSSVSGMTSYSTSILQISSEIEIQFHQVVKDFRTFDSSVSSSIEGTLQLIAQHILLPSQKTLQIAGNASPTASPQQHYMISFEKMIRIQDVINYFHPDLEQLSQHLVSIAQQYHTVIDSHRMVIENYEVEWRDIIASWENDIIKINELEDLNQGIRSEFESIETQARKLLSELELSREKKLRHLAKELVPDILEPEQLTFSPRPNINQPRERSNSVFSDSPSEIIEKLASKICKLERELENRIRKDKERELLICEFAKILESNVKEAESNLIKQCREKRPNINSRSDSPCESSKLHKSNEKDDSLVQILRRQLEMKDRQIQQLKRVNESLKIKRTNGETIPVNSREDGAVFEEAHSNVSISSKHSESTKQSAVCVEPLSNLSAQAQAEYSHLAIELRSVIGNLKETEMRIRETDSKLRRVITSKRWIYHKSLALDQRGLINSSTSNDLSLEDSGTESLPNLMEQANLLCEEHDQIIIKRRELEKEKMSIIRRMNQLRTKIKDILHKEETQINEATQKPHSSEVGLNDQQEAYERVSSQVTESKLSIQSVESLIFSLQITLAHQLRILSSNLTTSRLQIASAKGELPTLLVQAKKFVHDLNATKNQLDTISSAIATILANRKLQLRNYGEIGVELNRIVSSAYLHRSQRTIFAESNDHDGVLVPLPKLDEWLQSDHQADWVAKQDIEGLRLIYGTFWSSLEVIREAKSSLQSKHQHVKHVLINERKFLDSSGMESENGLLGISRILDKIRDKEGVWSITNMKESRTSTSSPLIEITNRSSLIPTGFALDAAFSFDISTHRSTPFQSYQTSLVNQSKPPRPSSLVLDLPQPAIKKTRTSCPDLRLLVKCSPDSASMIPDRKYSGSILTMNEGISRSLRRRAYSFDQNVKTMPPKMSPHRSQTSSNSPTLSSGKKALTPLRSPDRKYQVRSVSASPEIRALRKIASSSSPMSRLSGTRSASVPPTLGLASITKIDSKAGDRTDILQQKLLILSQLRKEMDILERVNSVATYTSDTSSQDEEKRRFQAILRKKREYILRLKDLTKECQVALNSSS